MNILPELKEAEDELAVIRQTIHRHPEIAFTESETAKLVQQTLADYGLEVHAGLGTTGVVGIIDSQCPGPSIALRADMDALPMEEKPQQEIDYVSRNHGCSHSCGHDGHTTILLGAARYIARNPPSRGRVVLIFQPAEETGEGAERMLADGLLDQFPFEEIYGCHNMPLLGKGKAGLRVGPTLSSYADFNILVAGRGGHGASPHLCHDPLQVAARLAVELPSFIGRYVSAQDTATVSVGQFHAGTARNIIPDTAMLQGTIRTLSKTVQKDLVERIRQTCAGYESIYHCKITVEIEHEGLPCVNDPTCTAVAAEACQTILGQENVATDIPPYPFADDFAAFQDRVPGAYFFLGQDGVMVHEPDYDFDDALISVGASIFVDIVRQRLGLQE